MFQRLVSLYRRIVGGRTSPTSAAEDDERRVWVRYPTVARTTVQSVNNGNDTRLSARIRNISCGGANLFVNQAFQLGDMISIEVPGGTPESQSTVLACVVHVASEANGYWTLGCEFSESLPEEDLEAFVQSKERPNDAEKREWPRHPCDVTALCSLVSDPEKLIWPAQVLNLSPGGILLVVDRPVDAGATLDLQLTKADGTEHRSILACVIHVVTQATGERHLGCNFIHEMSQADFHALL